MEPNCVHIVGFKSVAQSVRELLPDLKVEYFENVDGVTNSSDVEILISKGLDAGQMLKKCPNIKWIQCISAGIDGLLKFCQKESIKITPKVTRYGGYLPYYMAEWVIARMIAHERRFQEQWKDQENCVWDHSKYYNAENRFLPDLTMGIIGVGDIGQIIAERCKQFGMTVLGVGRRELDAAQAPKCLDMYRSFDKVEEVLERCDYVCSVLPETPQTIGIFNGDVLKACSTKRSIFMNIGRGSAVSSSSLLHALESGWIRHAILDVVEEEPLPKDSPLWRHPEITIAPHVSGNVRPREVAQLFAENYGRWIRGEELKYVVDLNQGY